MLHLNVKVLRVLAVSTRMISNNVWMVTETHDGIFIEGQDMRVRFFERNLSGVLSTVLTAVIESELSFKLTEPKVPLPISCCCMKDSFGASFKIMVYDVFEQANFSQPLEVISRSRINTSKNSRKKKHYKIIKLLPVQSMGDLDFKREIECFFLFFF